MSKEIMDRRVTQRIPFETEVTIHFSDGKPDIKAVAANISVGGMQFVLPKGAVKLPPEEVITLSFHLPDHTQISIRGEVCRFSNSLDHNRKPVVSYAVKFQEVSQNIWNYVYDFCQLRFSGEEIDPALRPAVAPVPLQKLNQGSNPVQKSNESSLPPTDPTLMEWTLRDMSSGNTGEDKVPTGSFITPPDEPLMNWVVNNKAEETQVSETAKTEETAVPDPQTEKAAESVMQPQENAYAGPIPVMENNQPDAVKPIAEDQNISMNALETSMAELLKQMDPHTPTRDVASPALENTVSQQSEASDSTFSAETMDVPTVSPSMPETVSDPIAKNDNVPEPNDMEQPPLKRSLFSWSRKTPTPPENYEKDRLSENSGLSIDMPSSDDPLKQDNLPSLEFDVHFSQNLASLKPDSSAVPEMAKAQESPSNQKPEYPVHPVASPEIKPVISPLPSFISAEPTPPPAKEPEKTAVSEEIDISFMNRNSSMISLDQQMIDRIIHAMRTNSKKDPNSNAK